MNVNVCVFDLRRSLVPLFEFSRMLFQFLVCFSSACSFFCLHFVQELLRLCVRVCVVAFSRVLRKHMHRNRDLFSAPSAPLIFKSQNIENGVLGCRCNIHRFVLCMTQIYSANLTEKPIKSVPITCHARVLACYVSMTALNLIQAICFVAWDEACT